MSAPWAADHKAQAARIAALEAEVEALKITIARLTFITTRFLSLFP